MKQVTPHLGLANSVLVSNVWLFSDPLDRTFLVDCGHVLERPALKRSLHRAGIRDKGDLDGVILTHRHSDHAGNAAWLRENYDAPIFCHEDDAPYLTGEEEAPPLATSETPLWARPICRLEDRYPAKTAVDETFGHGSWKFDFQVVHSPGHTEGSVMLYHAPTKTLFSGDVILAGAATIRFVERIRFADPAFSYDASGCRDAVKEFLKELPRTETVCSGHGPLIQKDAHQKMKKLLDG